MAKILVVDDQPHIVRLLQMELERDAHEVLTAADGEEALQKIRQERPALVVLDVNMPRKNGFECLAEIKHDDKLRPLPVIVLSTSYEQDVVNLLYKKGAHYYIRKPADFAQLKKVILQALTLVLQEDFHQPTPEEFVLKGTGEELKP